MYTVMTQLKLLSSALVTVVGTASTDMIENVQLQQRRFVRVVSSDLAGTHFRTGAVLGETTGVAPLAADEAARHAHGAQERCSDCVDTILRGFEAQQLALREERSSAATSRDLKRETVRSQAREARRRVDEHFATGR